MCGPSKRRLAVRSKRVGTRRRRVFAIGALVFGFRRGSAVSRDCALARSQQGARRLVFWPLRPASPRAALIASMIFDRTFLPAGPEFRLASIRRRPSDLPPTCNWHFTRGRFARTSTMPTHQVLPSRGTPTGNGAKRSSDGALPAHSADRRPRERKLMRPRAGVHTRRARLVQTHRPSKRGRKTVVKGPQLPGAVARLASSYQVRCEPTVAAHVAADFRAYCPRHIDLTETRAEPPLVAPRAHYAARCRSTHRQRSCGVLGRQDQASPITGKQQLAAEARYRRELVWRATSDTSAAAPTR